MHFSFSVKVEGFLIHIPTEKIPKITRFGIKCVAITVLLELIALT